MKTKSLFSSVLFCMLIFNILNNQLYSQEPGVKADQPVIEIKSIPLQQALVLKAEVPTREIGPKMGEMYAKLFSYAGQNNIQPAGAPFAVYYSFDPQGKTSFEAGFPVTSKINVSDSISYKEFPAMKVVTTLYKGPYENMVPVYTQLQEYIGKNNLKAIGVSWEVYLTDPSQVKSPNDNQTIIYFPIE
jgi:effector-binding domain-containing protein